jgi:hypothetical protein
MVSMEAKNRTTPALCKTRMCKFFGQGTCSKGDKCSFAHGVSDLHNRPNLHKTQLCMAFERNGTCRDGPACKYAHGESELQSNSKRPSVAGYTNNAKLVSVPVAVQVVVLNNAAFGSVSVAGAAPMLLKPVQAFGVLTQCSSLSTSSFSRDESMAKHRKDDDICSVLTSAEDLDFELESLGSTSRQTSDWSSISEEDSNERIVAEFDSSSQCQFTSDASSEASENTTMRSIKQENTDLELEVLESRLHRTKMCKFFVRGDCAKGSMCKFAHGTNTLQSRPNLFRTSLCMAFERFGSCKMGDDCKYAHGTNQLKKLSLHDDIEKGTGERQKFPSSVAAKVDNMLKQVQLRSKFSTHEASGIVVSAKKTFLHLRSPELERSRRRSSSC